MTNSKYQRKRIKRDQAALIAQLRKAIVVYAREQGTTVERAVSDALVDIRHLCDIWRLDFDALDDDAHGDYLEELEYAENPDEPHASDCAQHLHSAAECTCFKSESKESGR